MGPRMVNFMYETIEDGRPAMGSVDEGSIDAVPPNNWQEGRSGEVFATPLPGYENPAFEDRTEEMIALGLWPNPNQTNAISAWTPVDQIDDSYSGGLEQLCGQLQYNLRRALERASEKSELARSHMDTIARLNRALQWIEDQDGDLLPARDMAMINYVLRGIEP